MNAYIEESCDFYDPLYANIDNFKIQIDASQGSKAKTISPNFLSKIWNIHPDLDAKKLNQITQLNPQGAHNNLSRNCSTNDHMFCYKHINSKLFIDTLFATAKGKSTRGNYFCQIFVSYKVFVAVYPIEQESV